MTTGDAIFEHSSRTKRTCIVPIHNLFLQGEGHLQAEDMRLTWVGPGFEITLLDNETPRQALERTIVLLKLFSGQVAWADQVISEADGMKIHYYYPWKTGQYIINDEDLRKFGKFWDKFRQINTKNFAVWKFLSADFNPNAEDLLLSYVQVLEFLFVPEGKRGAGGYINKRCRALLGSEMDKDQKRLLEKRLYHTNLAYIHFHLQGLLSPNSKM